ncbi:MAG: DUF1573 domain-containing protein [Crocinitomicaceae bacterium]|nr:DUF1573 domain-containing protein [Crocinitomicaceae bacterium]
MKLYFAIIIIALNSAFGFGQTAEFRLDKAVFKFPKTYEGTQLEHDYLITNTGEVPLIISDYEVSCSCTTVDLPTSPILPRDTFALKVHFDTEGKYQFQDRIVYLTANTRQGTHKIRFKVNVIPKNE